MNHLTAAVRRATRKRQRVLSGASSIDESGDLPCAHTTEDVALSRVGLADAARVLEHSLTPDERRVLTARAVGYSPQEICSLVGLSPKQVENSLYRARVKMRASTVLADIA